MLITALLVLGMYCFDGTYDRKLDDYQANVDKKVDDLKEMFSEDV